MEVAAATLLQQDGLRVSFKELKSIGDFQTERFKVRWENTG